MKKKPTLPKKDRQPRYTNWDALECQDWIADHQRHEWKKSEKYKEAAQLAEKFKSKSS
jgi:hypothetical protein